MATVSARFQQLAAPQLVMLANAALFAVQAILDLGIPIGPWSEERVAAPSEAVSAAMKAGSALLFLGSTHHGGGTNRTADQYRTRLTMGLDSAAVRQEENMYLALSPDVVKSYPEQIQRLLGWSYMPETYMGWVEIDGEMADPIRLLG